VTLVTKQVLHYRRLSPAVTDDDERMVAKERSKVYHQIIIEVLNFFEQVLV
jgi:hypothetical protein